MLESPLKSLGGDLSRPGWSVGMPMGDYLEVEDSVTMAGTIS